MDDNPKYKWTIKRKYKGAWKDITKHPQKTGISAPFNFGPQVVGEQFLLEVFKETKNIFTQKNETHKMGEIIVIPKSSKEPKITKVVLFNKGARDVNKANYTDKLIARAYCVGMFNKTINFHLWEDDATGGGHNATINKNNRHNRAYPARVNVDGIAEAEISLSADQNVLKQIANRMMMRGDSSEGAFHEFYVTASYMGKILNANQTNVEVANPDYKIPKPQRTSTTNSPQRTTTTPPSQPQKQEENLLAKSINFVVDAVIGAFETPEKTRTASSVGHSQTQQPTDGKCPNCEKDIILEQIKAICVSKKNKKGIETCLVKDDTFIKAALPFLNKYRKKADINSCITKAHFIAQICQETKFYDLQEGFKYTNPERMRKLFYSYFKQFGELEKQQAEAKRLSDLSLDSKNWKTVANAIYGKTHPNGKNNTDKDDGWRYSGKGYKQITWRDNYNKVQKTAKNTFGKDITWLDGDNPYKLVNNQEDAILSALAFWKQNSISNVATEISDSSVKNVTLLINPGLAGYDERVRYFKKAVEILQVEKCKPKGKLNDRNEKSTVVIVSGTDTKIEKDPYKPNEFSWVMYKTSVFKNMSLKTYYDLEKSNSLPEADYITYLSRDTHQTSTTKGEILEHSNKRFGKYNEIPPGDYFLVPGISGQKYKIYVIDSESKSAAAENGIDGPDGSRGGVALHHYCPRFSVGCFTFNSGADKTPVQELIDNLPDLPIGDKKPVHFIVKPRKVKETTWDNSNYGTKKWIGI